MIEGIMKEFQLTYGSSTLPVTVEDDHLLWYLEPGKTDPIEDIGGKLRELLNDPVGSPPLAELLSPKDQVVIVVDDLTRPTPQEEILPPLVEVFNSSGISNDRITIVIALGTHRYMTDQEIDKRFGDMISEEITIENSPWKDPDQFRYVDDTSSGTPVHIYSKLLEADLVIGVGCIEPHVHAGWSGGSKIIQPGVSSWETTAATHLIAPKSPQLFEIAGTADNVFRKEIDAIAELANLQFIVNVVVGADYRISDIFAGDPVEAHRTGVRQARTILEGRVEERANIAVVSASPAEIDYWQGGKAVFLAQKGLKEGGVTILAGEFPEGVSPSHPDFEKYARKSYRSLDRMIESGTISDRVCGGALLMHSRLLERTKVICVSKGLSSKNARSLGFESTDSLADALDWAYRHTEGEPKVGVIDHGGMVVPSCPT